LHRESLAAGRRAVLSLSLLRPQSKRLARSVAGSARAVLRVLTPSLCAVFGVLVRRPSFVSAVATFPIKQSVGQGQSQPSRQTIPIQQRACQCQSFDATVEQHHDAQPHSGGGGAPPSALAAAAAAAASASAIAASALSDMSPPLRGGAVASAGGGGAGVSPAPGGGGGGGGRPPGGGGGGGGTGC
jgi:hypothetical protein